MIFVTVGSEIRFDRLIKAVDLWCSSHRNIEVFGQISTPGTNGYIPSYFKWESHVSPQRYDHFFNEAELILSHAGMGSIITALVKGKPIIIMPRQSELMETRNDHQIETASRFSERKNIMVAKEESYIGPLLNEWITGERRSLYKEKADDFASDRLIKCVRDFIFHK